MKRAKYAGFTSTMAACVCLAGCGSSSPSQQGTTAGSDGIPCFAMPTPPPSGTLVTTRSAPEYIGLTVAQGQALALRQGGSMRITEQNGKCFGLTDDLRIGRVDVGVQDGKVRAAVVEFNPIVPSP